MSGQPETKHGLICVNLGTTDDLIQLADPSDQKAWHEARKGRVSGSTVAVILGISPWADTEAMYNAACRLNRWVPDLEAAPKQEVNVYMKLGQIWEETALAAYRYYSGLPVHHFNTHLYALPSDPERFCATPDGLIGKHGVLELKTSFSKSAFPATVPLYYWTQCMLEMACTKRKWCHLVFWKPTHVTDPNDHKRVFTSALRVFRIDFDQFAFDNCIMRFSLQFLNETARHGPMTFEQFDKFLEPLKSWHKTLKGTLPDVVAQHTKQITLPIEVYDAATMRSKRKGKGEWVRYMPPSELKAFLTTYKDA